MNYYQIAIEIGLTPEQAKCFATAMTHKIKPSIDHLRIIK